MAMAFRVSARGLGGPALGLAVLDFERSLRDDEAMLSLWDHGSPMSALARGELEADDAPAEVCEVLALCDAWVERSAGAFSPRLTARAARRLPVPYPEGAPDPTGLVKTWAVARALPEIARAGAEGWLVDAAGDVCAGGVGTWRVGIADPSVTGDAAGSAPIAVIELGGDGPHALATSGGAQVRDHIWDPQTGAVARHYLQVSVLGDDLVACDAWATAIAGGGPAALARAHREGFEVLAVTGRRSGGGFDAVATPGWPEA